MLLRQEGVVMSEMMTEWASMSNTYARDFNKSMTLIAYRTPQEYSDSARMEAARNFRNEVEVRCFAFEL